MLKETILRKLNGTINNLEITCFIADNESDFRCGFETAIQVVSEFNEAFTSAERIVNILRDEFECSEEELITIANKILEI